MEKLYKAYPDKLKAIGWLESISVSASMIIAVLGVSNVSVEFMERLLSDPEVTVRPAVNQVELHPCVVLIPVIFLPG